MLRPSDAAQEGVPSEILIEHLAGAVPSPRARAGADGCAKGVPKGDRANHKGKEKHSKRCHVEKEKGREKYPKTTDYGKEKVLKRESAPTNVERERGKEKDSAKSKDGGKKKIATNVDREYGRGRSVAKVKDDGKGTNPTRVVKRNSNVGLRAGRQHSSQHGHPSGLFEKGGGSIHLNKTTNDTTDSRIGRQHSLKQRGRSARSNIASCGGHRQQQKSLQNGPPKPHDRRKKSTHVEQERDSSHLKRTIEDNRSRADRRHLSQQLSPVEDEGGSSCSKTEQGNIPQACIPDIPTYKVKLARSGSQSGRKLTGGRDSNTTSGPAAGELALDKRCDNTENNTRENKLIFNNQRKKESPRVREVRMRQRHNSNSEDKLKKLPNPEIIDAIEPRERRTKIVRIGKQECRKSHVGKKEGRESPAKAAPNHQNKPKGSPIRKDVRNGTGKAVDQSKSADSDGSIAKRYCGKFKNEGYKKKESRRGRPSTRNGGPRQSLSPERVSKRDHADKGNSGDSARHHRRSKTLDVPRRRERTCSSEHHPLSFGLHGFLFSLTCSSRRVAKDAAHA